MDTGLIPLHGMGRTNCYVQKTLIHTSNEKPKVLIISVGIRYNTQKYALRKQHFKILIEFT